MSLLILSQSAFASSSFEQSAVDSLLFSLGATYTELPRRGRFFENQEAYSLLNNYQNHVKFP